MKLVYQLVNLYGPISTANSQLIISLLNSPNDNAWLQAKNIVISDRPIMTLRSAVKRITNGKKGLDCVPDAFTLYRAIKYSVEKRKQSMVHLDVSDSET